MRRFWAWFAPREPVEGVLAILISLAIAAAVFSAAYMALTSP